jgi:flavin reductase (DIM6/NTAB) family NADH-FMN oxidoreductase RutF
LFSNYTKYFVEHCKIKADNKAMFKNINITEAFAKPIEKIGKDWTLISAGDINNFNMMTASWGGVGFLWNKPVAFIFVRPNRYTFEFIEKQPVFTLSFFAPEDKHILSYCGSHSGRNEDKAKACNLSVIATSSNSISFKEAQMYFECRKLYAQDMDEKSFIDTSALTQWYGKDPLHRVYVGEILNAMAK